MMYKLNERMYDSCAVAMGMNTSQDGLSIYHLPSMKEVDTIGLPQKVARRVLTTITYFEKATVIDVDFIALKFLKQEGEISVCRN